MEDSLDEEDGDTDLYDEEFQELHKQFEELISDIKIVSISVAYSSPLCLEIHELQEEMKIAQFKRKVEILKKLTHLY